MSDFSAGIFTVNKNKEKVYPYLTKDEVFIEYNEAWVGKLSSMDMDTDYEPQTLALSKEVPLLHIINAEDHGFLMRILHEGVVKFHFETSYDIQERLFNEVAHELYGDDCWDIMLSSIGTSDDKMKRANEVTEKRFKDENILETTIETVFADVNKGGLKTFEIFGFDEEIMQNIKHTLTIENYTENIPQMVYNLLDCLGLKQFSFVSHRYVSHGDDDRFTILNS